MTTDSAGIVGRTALDIAGLVRSGEVSPVEVVDAHLDRIDSLDGRIGAFEHVCAREARDDAEALASRGDLADLPLAGVPVAIKDNTPVAGQPLRYGGPPRADERTHDDHEVVRRLKAAGAVVVGITRMPEVGLWATSDSATGVTQNPWQPGRTPGGSSGGSAAAVATGMVPVAHGNDGLGSIRIPAACCGLFGIKPGTGIVPSDIGTGRRNFFDLVEHGPLATTVADAATVLAVMAGLDDLAQVRPPQGRLRIGVSTKIPLPGARFASEWEDAAITTARLLADAGHHVEQADPPAPFLDVLALVGRWLAYAADETRALDRSRLPGRTRVHAAIGEVVDRLPLLRPSQREHFRAVNLRFFADHDLLLTPMLAMDPIASDMRDRAWPAVVKASLDFAPTAGAWNLAGFPAAAVPAGVGPAGLPLSVQLVAPDGGERLVLSVAKQLEDLSPWPRHAPNAAPGPAAAAPGGSARA